VAKATADADKQRLDTLRKGPSQAVLDTADQAVDNAQAVLDNANDRLNDINSHPTPAEMRDARDRVTQAQAALTRARNQPATAISTDDGANALDVTILEQAIAQEQAGVAALEKNLTDTKLLAPFAGTVTSVYVRPGDSVDPAHPALTLTKPGALGLRVDLTDQDAARLKVGQPARITMDGGDGAPYAGTVASVTANTSGLGRTAVIKVDWPKDVPTIGRTATVMITVVHKDDVLLVPRKAVHSAGQTRYVQYLNGSSRKVANIQIGITSGDLIEVVSGLTEGQIVVVAP
jgi:HlyD family secretion protein